MMTMNEQRIAPRILRYHSAPAYLGMCRAEFNKTVRPFVKEFPIGSRGVGFDRRELDEWADNYIAVHSSEKKSKPEIMSECPCDRTMLKSTEQSKTEFKRALELTRRR